MQDVGEDLRQAGRVGLREPRLDAQLAGRRFLLGAEPTIADIAEAAVFGVPDRLAYESVATYIVPATGRTVEPETVQNWVATHMAAFAVPRHVRIVDVIPRNRTGKIDKLALRETMELELQSAAAAR